MASFTANDKNLVANGTFDQVTDAPGTTSDPIFGWQAYAPSTGAPVKAPRLLKQTETAVVQSGDTFTLVQTTGNALISSDISGSTADKGVRQEVEFTTADIGTDGYFKIEFDWKGGASATKMVDVYFAGTKIGTLDTTRSGWKSERFLVQHDGDTADIVFYDANGANISVDNVSIIKTGSGNSYTGIDGSKVGAGAPTASADTFVGGEFDDNVSMLAGNDRVDAGRGNDSVSGGDGDDTIYGGVGRDTLRGDAGNDLLVGGRDGDVIDGGAGFDIVSYEYADGAIEVALWDTASNKGDAATDTLIGIEAVRGTLFNDSMTGGGSADQLEGSAGNDTLNGGDGNDTLLGGAGNDSLTGGQGNDSLDGGVGDDTYVLSDFSDSVVEAAGSGTDTALVRIYDTDSQRYLSSTDFTVKGNSVTNKLTGQSITLAEVEKATFAGDGVTVDLITGTNPTTVTVTLDAATANYTGADAAKIYNATGNTLANTLTGNALADTLTGLAGNDTLVGLGGVDVLDGGDGNDNLKGGAGGDSLVGGAGTDTADYSTSTAGVTVNLTLPGAQAGGGDAAGDTLSGIENVTGSASGDVLTGDDGVNVLTGGAGNDTISGGKGYDTLLGGAGADKLDGGEGSDIVNYFDSAAGVTVNLSLTGAQSGGDAAGDTLSGIEGIYASNQNDSLIGDDTGNGLYGFAGNDTIDGGKGGDYIRGDAGADNLTGGEGFDYASYTASTVGVTVSLAQATGHTGGDAAGDTLSGFEGLYGSNYADKLTGDDAGNWLLGFTGKDTLDGGKGDDYLRGGVDGDVLIGGEGSDVADYLDSTVGVTVNLTLTGAQKGGDAEGDTLSGIEQVHGSNFADVLTGDGGANWLLGRGGNDSMTGGDGNDTLEAGDNDTVDGGAGTGDVVKLGFTRASSTVVRSGTDYTITNGTSKVTVKNTELAQFSGESTATSIELLAPSTVTVVMAAADTDYTASSKSSKYLVTGNALDNTILGNDLADTISGGAGNDYLRGMAGDDSLTGGDGNDQLEGGTGADTLNGGAGRDYALYYYSTAGVTVNLTLTGAQSGGHAAGDILIGIENVQGSNLADKITGDDNDNTFNDYAGNDTIDGGKGNDYVYAGDGADLVAAGDGVDLIGYLGSTAGVTVNLASTAAQSGGFAAGDTLSGFENLYATNFADKVTGNDAANSLYGFDGNDTIDGGANNDIITGGTGADSLTGGAGTMDYVAYSNSTAGVTVDLTKTTAQSGGDAAGDTLAGFEGIYGSNFADSLTGDGQTNNFYAGDGNDTVIGGAGSDYIQGAGGADSLVGGDGTDTVSYTHTSVGVTIDLSKVGVSQGAAGENDTLSGFENIYGSLGNDSLKGDAGANTIHGMDGNDTLNGDAGNDVLNGSVGNDLLIGGAGNDGFYFTFAAAPAASWGTDTISDFQDGTDRIWFDLPDGIAVTSANFANYVNIAASGADALVTLKAVTGSVPLTPNGESILVKSIAVANLTFADFGFY